MTDYIGPATPTQLVKIRLGRFSRYASEGGGHQLWDEAHYPCSARVGTKGSNPDYSRPWQPKWVLAAGEAGVYKIVPNVLTVKLDKSLEIGALKTATITIDNILYPDAGGYHVRERGSMSPLRGYVAPGTPVLPALLDEWGTPVPTNEWEGRFSFEAQITIYQGYGSNLVKVFTGLIEENDIVSKPDQIILTARDFGKVFTDEHFFGWNKDPVISTPVTFVDSSEALAQRLVGYNPHASSEEKPTYTPARVLDYNEKSYWRSALVHTSAWTEYVEIALPAGRYKFADIAVKYPHLEVFVGLRPAPRSGGPAERNGEECPLDEEGWVDLTGTESQIVPGAGEGEHGGNSYINHIVDYPLGQQGTPFDPENGIYEIGANSVLRLSFRNLRATEGGNRAGVKEFHAMHEELKAEVGKQEWVVTEDIADVIRVICQWAGFKEWDIPNTGAHLPHRFLANPGQSYLDVIKQIAEGIGFNFYMADPAPDAAPGGIESLGIPTFRRSKVLEEDIVGALPLVTDRTLLTGIQMKESNEPLPYVIRMYGTTNSRPGDAALEVKTGQKIVYTFRPPWAGTPPTYTDSRLAGIIKQVIHKTEFFATLDELENGALIYALRDALASVQAVIEIPGYPGLDIEDHLLLMDLGTGLSTRMSITQASSTFTDGEKRKWVASLTGTLIDTPDVRDMVNIIQDPENFPPNGAGGEWADPKIGTGTSLGFG